MIPKTSFKEFEKDFRQLTGDSIKKLVMAKIVETPAYVVKELGLEFPPGQSLLWGLLIFGQQGIHFFVHASESALATMFRNAPVTGAWHLLLQKTSSLPQGKTKISEGAISSGRPAAGKKHLHPDTGAHCWTGRNHSPVIGIFCCTSPR